MKNNKILYFAYGSNLSLLQMSHRCPHSVPIGKAVLPGYRLEFRGNTRGFGVAHVEPAEGENVVGGLWEIDPRDLKALDRYEGYPRLYDRGTVSIRRGSQMLDVMTYWMTPGHFLARPQARYVDTIEEGYKDFGLDVEIFREYYDRHRADMQTNRTVQGR